jgi:uncharacterized OsmC-like protein
MLGTLVAALEVRGIAVPEGGVVADVTGENVLEEGIPVLRTVRVAYTLDLPAADPEKVARALAGHAGKCPTARALAGAVSVTWEVVTG